MAIKKFDVLFGTETKTIEYEDDITFGELENILNKCLDLSDVAKPKVNIPLYRQLILTTVIKKAPFKVNEIAEIRNLKVSEAKLIMSEVMKDYPLMKYLEEWVETFVGEEIQNTLPVSTISSQGNSVGQNNK
tara:strand:+ start:2229 stop:2624 length:396 start_codon:yes stop_codon:yes gene_type:complete